ncbi:type II toxin-antitoxin system RelE/ParE family toxin [Inquilinus sp. OTU3971]|uniref:type II toxin-antitoxin system RelE/ParE family toxin n=1 Tax=Inquilinus sp. OTU3971 TaxID=3043855 RepID=UPI00313B699D
MPHLIWSPAALRDVDRLHRLLAAKNRDAAQRVVRSIREGVTALARHPDAGRPAEGMEPEFREWIIPFGRDAYLALYRHTGSDVVILAVRHGREAGY